MRVGVAGVGAVGRRVAEQIMAAGGEVVLYEARPRSDDLIATSGGQIRAGGSRPGAHEALDCLVISTPAPLQLPFARTAIRLGVPVISTADTIEAVRALTDLHAEAQALEVPIVLGAGFAPGLTCVLARYAARSFDEVHEVHVAKHGTGGPACARAHHRALKTPALDWRDGGWTRRPGGSGRELVWFPEPVEGADCYRGALPDALLLHELFPKAHRITARMAATRQDRFTAWLPMLSPPHAEGDVGAVRVEVRGLRAGSHAVEVLGAVARPAEGAAIVACQTALLTTSGGDGAAPLPGANSLGSAVEPASFLSLLRERGLRAWEFEGLSSAH